jgi:hypothetical protein
MAKAAAGCPIVYQLDFQKNGVTHQCREQRSLWGVFEAVFMQHSYK